MESDLFKIKIKLKCTESNLIWRFEKKDKSSFDYSIVHIFLIMIKDSCLSIIAIFIAIYYLFSGPLKQMLIRNNRCCYILDYHLLETMKKISFFQP